MKPKLFLIHGWNMPPLVWDWLIEKLDGQFEIHVATLPGYPPVDSSTSDLLGTDSLDCLTELLAQAPPDRSHWCGWSLGATLAMEAAIAFPDRISKLTLISPTARFFEDADWPHGISASVFDRLLRISQKKYVVGLQRFLQMQMPGEDRIELRSQLADRIGSKRPTDLALQQGYETLSNTDLRERLNAIAIPTQVIAANSDDVISPMASRLCADQIPNAIFHTIGNCHCLPITQSPALAKRLLDFSFTTSPPASLVPGSDSQPPIGSVSIESSLNMIDRAQVARQFSKAAKTYDDAAKIPQEMGRLMVDQISASVTGALIDLGCGTGEALEQISKRWPKLKLVGVDFASAMIEAAEARIADAEFLVADIEETGLPSAMASVVFSCAAMQWCHPHRAIAEAERLLRPGGQFLMTTFVSGTLPEFREAWRRVSPGLNRVHDLATESDWRQAFTESGFEVMEFNRQQRCQTFESVDELLLRFRQLGAKYAGHDRTPLSREDYLEFRRHLADLTGSRPELTYECLTVVAKKTDG